MSRRQTPLRRDGFTLVELLLVVAILAVLMGMVGAAFLPQYSRAKSNATRTLVKKLDGVIMQHWSAAMKQAYKEPIPPQVVAMAGGNQKVARAIWVKLQMKAEFPMSFAEAVDPWHCDFRPGLNPFLNGVPVPKSTVYYAGVVTKRNAANTNPRTEAAAMLLLALQRPRDGRSFNAESALGASALRDTDNDGLKEIVDLWDVPVGFYRWGTSNVELDALNKTASGLADRDKEDSEHALMDQNWHLSLPVGVQVFETMCHPIHTGSGASYQTRSWYTEPVVVSAGRDEVLDLNALLGAGVMAEDNIVSFKQR